MSLQVYFISMAALFGTPILIFGLKYWSAALQAKARFAEESDYRKFAADAAAVQSGNTATLSAIQSELADIKSRMASGRAAYRFFMDKRHCERRLERFRHGCWLAPICTVDS